MPLPDFENPKTEITVLCGSLSRVYLKLFLACAEPLLVKIDGLRTNIPSERPKAEKNVPCHPVRSQFTVTHLPIALRLWSIGTQSKHFVTQGRELF